MDLVGCHVGHLSYAGLGYADDVALLTPSIQAVQEWSCEDFAEEYTMLNLMQKRSCVVYWQQWALTTTQSDTAWVTHCMERECEAFG